MKEKISSLFDNEISERDLDLLINDVTKKQENQKNWMYYQITRDVMRGDFVSSTKLKDKIMDAIDAEPTQLGGFSSSMNSNATLKSQFNYWPHLFGFVVVLGMLFTFMNVNIQTESAPVLLVQDDIPSEILSAHYAHTASTANYFVQTGFNE